MTTDTVQPKNIIEETDTPAIIVGKIAAILTKPRHHLEWPELSVLEGYDWEKGTRLDPNSPDYQAVKARQSRQTEMGRERSWQLWGAEMRRDFPEFLGTGTVQEVMGQCKTPQQKATLVLRQAGRDLQDERLNYPDFQALVSELKRIADTPRGETPDLIPNDVCRSAVKEAQQLASGPERVGDGAINGDRRNGIQISNFIATIVREGLAETSSQRRSIRPTQHPTASFGANLEDLLAD